MSRANETVHPYEVVKHYYGGMEESSVPGITLREHFAAIAMGAWVHEYAPGAESYAAIANASVRLADALIAELAKPVQS